MHTQSVDQLTPLLQMLQQPAFCLRQDGSAVCNREAQNLTPSSADALDQWLGESAELYAQWKRQDPLTLPIFLGRHSASVVIYPLSDGTLFLISNHEHLTAGADSMSVTAQVLRQPLSELSTLTQQLTEVLEDVEDPLIQSQSSAITRQVYRLSRITCNLADLEQIRNGTYVFHPERLPLSEFLEKLCSEMSDVCRSIGQDFAYQLPKNPITVSADPALLERAILNLLSNAIKYGTRTEPIVFQVRSSPSSVLFQMKNTCSKADGELLSAAFQRLSQRGILPDPQWGIGLGLPLTRYIAHLMGGAVAVELTKKNEAVITMSISRKQTPLEVRSPICPPVDYTGGMRHSLVELSDVLPDSCFHSNFI